MKRECPSPNTCTKWLGLLAANEGVEGSAPTSPLLFLLCQPQPMPWEVPAAQKSQQRAAGSGHADITGDNLPAT